jgi:hypothetical protein
MKIGNRRTRNEPHQKAGIHRLFGKSNGVLADLHLPVGFTNTDRDSESTHGRPINVKRH